MLSLIVIIKFILFVLILGPLLTYFKIKFPFILVGLFTNQLLLQIMNRWASLVGNFVQSNNIYPR